MAKWRLVSNADRTCKKIRDYGNSNAAELMMIYQAIGRWCVKLLEECVWCRCVLDLVEPIINTDERWSKNNKSTKKWARAKEYRSHRIGVTFFFKVDRGIMLWYCIYLSILVSTPSLVSMSQLLSQDNIVVLGQQILHFLKSAYLMTCRWLPQHFLCGINPSPAKVSMAKEPLVLGVMPSFWFALLLPASITYGDRR